MKRFLVILILFVFIGGGGVGGLIMLGVIPNPFNPSKQGVSEEATAAAKKAEQAAKPFDAPTSVIPFVNMRDLMIPVVINGQIKTRVYLSVRLWVAPGMANAVEANEPKYEDAVLADFMPYFSTHFAKSDMLNLAEIKRRLVRLAKKIHGDNVVDVLIINVFEQKFGSGE